MALQAKAEGIAKAKEGEIYNVDNLTDEEIFDDLASLGVEVFGREGRSQVSQQGQRPTSQVTPATSGPSTNSDDLARKQENSARIKVIDSIIADHKSGKDHDGNRRLLRWTIKAFLWPILPISYLIKIDTNKIKALHSESGYNM